MIIYLCIKFQSNTPILTKDITQKPFFKVENFSKLKRAISPKIIGGFYPKSNLAYILWYNILVYKISIQYYNPFKRYPMETKGVTYGTDETGQTDVQTVVILYPPIENCGGIINIKWIHLSLIMWKEIFGAYAYREGPNQPAHPHD